METNDTPTWIAEFDRDEIVKRIVALFDIHRFGNARVFLVDTLLMCDEIDSEELTNGKHGYILKGAA